MENLNSVIVEGRFVTDPFIKSTNGDKLVATVTLATTGFREKVSFLKLEAWGKVAENLRDNTGKDTWVIVEGRIESREYQNVTSHIIVIQAVRIRSPKVKRSESPLALQTQGEEIPF